MIYIGLAVAYALGVVFLMKYLSTKVRFMANLTGCSSCNSGCS